MYNICCYFCSTVFFDQQLFSDCWDKFGDRCILFLFYLNFSELLKIHFLCIFVVSSFLTNFLPKKDQTRYSVFRFGKIILCYTSWLRLNLRNVYSICLFCMTWNLKRRHAAKIFSFKEKFRFEFLMTSNRDIIRWHWDCFVGPRQQRIYVIMLVCQSVCLFNFETTYEISKS